MSVLFINLKRCNKTDKAWNHLIYIFAGRPRSTMDSIRVSEAPDTGSIPVEATKVIDILRLFELINRESSRRLDSE